MDIDKIVIPVGWNDRDFSGDRAKKSFSIMVFPDDSKIYTGIYKTVLYKILGGGRKVWEEFVDREDKRIATEHKEDLRNKRRDLNRNYYMNHAEKLKADRRERYWKMRLEKDKKKQ